jgi:hypothetical protein
LANRVRRGWPRRSVSVRNRSVRRVRSCTAASCSDHQGFSRILSPSRARGRTGVPGPDRGGTPTGPALACGVSHAPADEGGCCRLARCRARVATCARPARSSGSVRELRTSPPRKPTVGRHRSSDANARPLRSRPRHAPAGCVAISGTPSDAGGGDIAQSPNAGSAARRGGRRARAAAAIACRTAARISPLLAR